MPTMNISLTDEFADFVSSEIERGEYASASEMMRDALRLMKRDRDMDEVKLQLLREHLAPALEQAKQRDFSNRTVAQIAQSIRQEDDE